MMKEKLGRKNFIKVSGAALGMGVLGSFIPSLGFSENLNLPNQNSDNIILKNVKLETGFERDDFEVIKTKTELFVVEIENGKIKSIKPNSDVKGAIDAKGFLMLPAMKDMHIHLDKTFYGDGWKARSGRNKTVKDMIAFEQKEMPNLLKNSTFKAEKIIELLQSRGTNFARSHVNIEPTSKLQSLKNLQKAIENKKRTFGVELVAFPQHGIFASGSDQLMKEAAQMNIDFIGGLDPYSIEGNVEKTIDYIVRLALDYNKGIDIHLHETGEGGLKSLNYLITAVNENPILKGKTFLSHAFVLGDLEGKKLDEACLNLADAEIGIISTVPIGKRVMPLPTLYKHGVKLMTGTDSVVDHWSTFGTGNMLTKANLMGQLYGWNTEFDLSRCLRIATNDVLPLNENGDQVWPKTGDLASFNLFDASCSAEVVARNSEVKFLYHNGLSV